MSGVTESQSAGIADVQSYLRALLENAKAEMASDGYLSERTRAAIVCEFGFWDYLFALQCSRAGPEAAKTEDRPSGKVADRQTEQRADIGALIEDRLERISELKGYASERENLAADAEARSFSLPTAEATGKLLRYEAHLDRQLYCAMDQLERLQRQRRGENVPPPFNVNFGRRA